MKRIEFMGHRRKSPLLSRNSTDTVMMLAQITLERRRLEQERSSLEKRLRRIDGRLHLIAGAETRLLPAIHSSATSAPKAGFTLDKAVPSRLSGVVLQY